MKSARIGGVRVGVAIVRTRLVAAAILGIVERARAENSMIKERVMMNDKTFIDS
tara:strand:+ start:55 stop:216 length:162 start_codon:yes stop_codon:yes gene_type:complete